MSKEIIRTTSHEDHVESEHRIKKCAKMLSNNIQLTLINKHISKEHKCHNKCVQDSSTVDSTTKQNLTQGND